MAEAEKQLLPPGETGKDAPKKRGKLKLIILAVLILAVLGGGGFAAWKLFLQNMLFGPKQQPVAAEGTIPATSLAAAPTPTPATDKDGKPLPPTLAPAPGLMLTLEPFMINLADTNARHFLRVIVAIDVETEAMKHEVELRMPRIRDALILLFGSKTSYDLTGTPGRLRLRMEILKVINNVLGVSNKITQAYYMEFVVQ